MTLGVDDLLPGHDHKYDGVPVTMPGRQQAGQVHPLPLVVGRLGFSGFVR